MKKYIFIVLVIVLAIVGTFVAYSNQKQQQEIVPQQSEAIQQDITLNINDGVDAKIFMVEYEQGLTAFDVLKQEADSAGLVLKTKTYDIGVLVEAIGEKENGQDGKYWMYYVNGTMPMVAADKQAVNPGDNIEFKFEKSSF